MLDQHRHPRQQARARRNPDPNRMDRCWDPAELFPPTAYEHYWPKLKDLDFAGTVFDVAREDLSMDRLTSIYVELFRSSPIRRPLELADAREAFALWGVADRQLPTRVRGAEANKRAQVVPLVSARAREVFGDRADWRGWTNASYADTCVEYLRRIGLEAYRHTPGNRGAYILRKLNEGTEFITVSFWETEDSIEAFAGKDLERGLLSRRRVPG